MTKTKIITALFAAAVLGLASGCATNGNAAAKPAVSITPELGSVDVVHAGKKTTIMRNQDENANVNPAFAKTSRKCPPFCIQPAQLAPGVDTIGEVEMLHYLKQMSAGDNSILVVDSRTPDWVEKGTIPGAKNLPWNKLNPASGASPFDIADIMEKEFGAKNQEGLWDFSSAKTLVMFCNGMWCGQSPTNIRTLLKFGYPAEKIKWYRGGMQNWENLGFTVVKP
ncbi:MAG: rhodanese-like domain-containing protein [Gammaproteobacteria bacterium]|nr:rhodanese-like domain-containing protein [Gammaproteobacteria bacterium]